MRVALAVGLAGLASTALAVSIPASPNATAYQTAGQNWSMWQGDPSGARFNGAETKINPQTVGNLKLKWAYSYAAIPYARTGSQPAIVDGVLYVGAPNSKFLALDAKTGATRWTFDLTTVVAGDTNSVRDGAAVVGNNVYFGDSTGRVYAVDRQSGRLVWARQVDTHVSARMTGSPLVHDGHVFIGVSTDEGGNARDPNFACCTHRGQVVSLNARTGAVDWRYYTVPEAKAVGTWPSGATKYSPSGGSVWSSPVVDADTGTIFVGTGNSATGSEGDIDTMLALDTDSGKPRWKHTLTSPDLYTAACDDVANEYCPGAGEYALDADIGASANVIDVGGRKLVAIGQKGGMFYALDARTGETVWQTELAKLDPSLKDPGSVGVEWGSVYDGKRIYAATQRSNPGRLFALDPATGKILWQTNHPADGCTTGGAAAEPELCELAFTPAVSGTPGLVYEGSADGKMRIFSAGDGKILWTYDAVRQYDGVNGQPGQGRGIGGNGGAVIADGMMYVQAAYFPFYASDKGGVLLAFGL
ncbi:MAG TPA: PQQ-binding-like beta-propeller repeat protein [Actinophytocola sp.]|jgi:polyvinyl alcohol dehydrogenase (cytochrome)